KNPDLDACAGRAKRLTGGKRQVCNIAFRRTATLAGLCEQHVRVERCSVCPSRKSTIGGICHFIRYTQAAALSALNDRVLPWLHEGDLRERRKRFDLFDIDMSPKHAALRIR